MQECFTCFGIVMAKGDQKRAKDGTLFSKGNQPISMKRRHATLMTTVTSQGACNNKRMKYDRHKCKHKSTLTPHTSPIYTHTNRPYVDTYSVLRSIKQSGCLFPWLSIWPPEQIPLEKQVFLLLFEKLS